MRDVFMISIGNESARLCDGWSRRELLRVGGLGWLGLSLPGLWGGEAAVKASAAAVGPQGSFGRAKSCIIFFLGGGPPQHETFDPKDEAPREIRGEFKSIATKVPGLRFSELLPLTAGIADKVSVVRSMRTDVNSHSTSGYWMLTGYPHASKAESLPPDASDWPSLASVVGALRPSLRSPFSSVVLPEPIQNNPAIPWPGQDGGYMGHTWNPQVFKCDPGVRNFAIEGLSPPEGLTSLRLSERIGLLQQVDEHFIRLARSEQVAALDRMQQKAFEAVQSSTTRAAFEMQRESEAMRERYGRHKVGQSVLLARRLIESGVRLVQVNWPREPGDVAVGNPLWDTHQKNAERLREVLCPQFDRTFSALIEDLEQRGMLDETLVVAMGEFGRTPKINAAGGRDHWGHCFSIALAGAGTGGGRIVGASDRMGGYPATRPIEPKDLAATIFYLLGISPTAEFLDPLGRPRMVTDNGTPIRELLAG